METTDVNKPQLKRIEHDVNNLAEELVEKSSNVDDSHKNSEPSCEDIDSTQRIKDEETSRTNSQVPPTSKSNDVGELVKSQNQIGHDLPSDEVKAPKEYIPPLENPYEKAWKYLFKHDILSLFQGITAEIASGLPEDPLEYMVNAIEQLQERDRRRKGINDARQDDVVNNKSPENKQDESSKEGDEENHNETKENDVKKQVEPEEDTVGKRKAEATAETVSENIKEKANGNVNGGQEEIVEDVVKTEDELGEDVAEKEKDEPADNMDQIEEKNEKKSVEDVDQKEENPEDGGKINDDLAEGDEDNN